MMTDSPRPSTLALALTLALVSTGCAESSDLAETETETAETETETAETDSTTDTLDTETSGTETDSTEITDTDTDGELCGAPACEDALVTDLGLHGDKVSEGAITNSQAPDHWLSSVDASAGGTMAAAMNPWIYARFTDEGLVEIEIDDLAALESGEWDIAAKRIGIRVNSGSSGSGCVGVATTASDFEALTEIPPGTEFASEDFYADDCTLIEDMSGQPGSPNYRMAGWWGYAGCVTTTGAVYLIERSDGRVVAFTVDAYYGEGQAECNEQGTMGSAAANFSWRWRFLN